MIKSYFKKKKRMSRYKKLRDYNNRVHCLIWIAKKKAKIILSTYLLISKVPDYCYEVKQDGEPTYLVGLDGDGFYPIEIPEIMAEGCSTLDLYEAKHCRDEVKEVYGFPASTMGKIKLGMFIVIMVVLIIIIFMMAMSLSEGTI